MIAAAGIALLLGPRLGRLANDLTQERRARIRSEEKAEIAAHLHDGVLQTLALIQHRAGPNREVAALARRQERELRDWLYRPGTDPPPPPPGGALTGELAAVEDDQQVPVELVLVGDVPLDEPPAPWWPPCGKRPPTPPATPAPTGWTSTSRSRPTPSLPTSATAARASTPPPCPRPARPGRQRHRPRAPRRRRRRRAQRAGRGHRDLAARPAGAAVSVRVFLVDDHALFRAGVRAELERQSDVVGRGGRRRRRRRPHPGARPDVVLLDVHLPGGGGVEVLAPPPAAHPEIRFLALSVSDAPDDVIAVIRAGARGYVTKSITGDDLADAVARVAAGDAVFSPRLAGFVLDAFAARSEPASPGRPRPRPLTPRERDVLRLIARGYTYKEIARRTDPQREDHRDPRVGRPAQAPAVQPPRAHPLGHRPPPL